MEYLSKVIKPFQDKSNTINNVALQKRKKESKIMIDPQNVDYYLAPIYITLQTQQNINMSYINPCYMSEIQREFNQEGRAVIIDTLFRLCKRFNSHKTTFHLAVFVIDSYLSNKFCALRDLNRLMDASFLIASKYEEIYPQPCRMYANRFEIDELLQLEKEILEIIDYRLIVGNAYVWLNYYWVIVECGEKNQEWIKFSLFLVDISTFCYQCLKYEPSKIACACIYMSMSVVGIKMDWNKLASQFNLHFQHEIREIANLLSVTLKEQIKLKRAVVTQIE